MTNERIDEMIDRVAAELTAVPSDPDFSARLRDRLEPPRRRSTGLLLLASATAAVLFAAIVIVLNGVGGRRDQAIVARGGVLVSRPVSSAGASALPTAGPADRPLRLGSPGRERPSVPRQADDVEGTPVAPDQDVLTVAPLSVEPMELPAAADLAPLQVPTLEISEISTGDGAKEPR